jgi:hypothetical protein
MVMLMKRLIACWSMYIMGFEECYEDLFVYGIYGALNIVHFRDSSLKLTAEQL